jgi:hypothetical protein
MVSVAKGEILPSIAAFTPEFIESWTVGNTCNQAPFLMEVLLRVAQTPQAKENNKKKHPEAVCIDVNMIGPYADIL